MTDRERNRFACAMAEPLWDLGYEVNWQHERDDALEMDVTHFGVRRGPYAGGWRITRQYMERIRFVEVAQRQLLRMVERAFLDAAANEPDEPDYPCHNHEEFTSSSPDYYGC